MTVLDLFVLHDSLGNCSNQNREITFDKTMVAKLILNYEH